MDASRQHRVMVFVRVDVRQGRSQALYSLDHTAITAISDDDSDGNDKKNNVDFCLLSSVFCLLPSVFC
jgi:hypothetical protein